MRDMPPLPPQPYPCPIPATGDELLDAAVDVCWRYLRGGARKLSPMDVAVIRLAHAVVRERDKRGISRPLGFDDVPIFLTGEET